MMRVGPQRGNAVTRRNGTSRVVRGRPGPAKKGLLVPKHVAGSFRESRDGAKITRERECDGCRETHVEVWCQTHMRWELEGSDGQASPTD